MLKAEDLEEEAKNLYDEIASLKAEEELSNTSPKIEKRRKQALTKDIEALENQKKANRLRYEMYERHLSGLFSDTSSGDMRQIKAKLLKEDASEFFYRASSLRNEAYNQTNQLENKFEKLNKAHSIESLGLEKMEKALASYYLEEDGAPKDSGSYSTQGQPGNGSVVVNKQLLQNIRKTLIRLDDATFSAQFEDLREQDTVSGDKLVELWYAYIYQKYSYPRYAMSEEEEVLPTEKTPANDSDEKSGQDSKQRTEPSRENDKTQKKEKFLSLDKEIAAKGAVEGALYKVQIAADQKPLSQSVLKKLYDGNKEVSRVVESGWYKYSVGDFKTFQAAEEFRNSLQTRDAFIVAVKDGEPVNQQLEKQANLKEKTEVPKPKEQAAHSEIGIVFKVQIAAARYPVSEKLLKEIYNGQNAIHKDLVEGWHKYSIGSFYNYSDADHLRKQTNVDGAFVTAYKDGTLIDTRRAIRLTTGKGKQTGQSSMSAWKDLDFKVQIAADRIQLDEERLNEIYSGVKKVFINKGEGWYRYSIGSCPTYFHALRLKQETPVKGAFVVVYQKGKRLNAYSYRQPSLQCPNLVIEEYSNSPDQVQFAVQIAASANKMHAYDLKYIYCGGKVHEHHSGEWYRYSVGSFDSYEEAENLKKTICVPGAFVVAYKGNKKLNVKEAISENR